MKHRVLKLYLDSWAQKLASRADDTSSPSGILTALRGLGIPMQDFFGHPLSPQLSEEALIQCYRDQLKSICGLQFAADRTILATHGTMRFDALWPVILEASHLTLTDVKQELWKMRQQRILLIEGVGPGERSVKDHHILRLPVG